MAISGHSILAVVPARGGSKGIPRKNLSLLGGRSLVQRVGELCSGLTWLDGAVLSTDDEEIASAGREAGLQVPFLRPDDLATDKAGSVEMWQHALSASEAAFGRRFDITILLEPTSPLRRAEDLKGAVELLISRSPPAVISVSPTPAHFSPQKTLALGEEGELRHYHESGAQHAQRQSIPSYYHRNGAVYAHWRSTLLDLGQILPDGTLPYIIDRPMVNIDDRFELDLAEWLLTR